MRTENSHKLVTRLLFNFADNVYGYLEDDRLKIYGPSPEVQMVVVLASNRLRVDLENFGLFHCVDDKLVVAFQYAYGCPGVLRSQPERAYGQGMLFVPAR